MHKLVKKLSIRSHSVRCRLIIHAWDKLPVCGYSVYLLIFPVRVKRFLLQHGKCRTDLRWSGTMDSYDRKRVLTKLNFLPSWLQGPSKPGFMLLHVTRLWYEFRIPVDTATEVTILRTAIKYPNLYLYSQKVSLYDFYPILVVWNMSSHNFTYCIKWGEFGRSSD